MIVDPRWYACFVAAVTGLSSNDENAGYIALRAESIADAAYERLLSREASLVANKPKEVKKGQVWRFKSGGPICVVEEIKGDSVFWRRGEDDDHMGGHAPGMLVAEDLYLIGEEPDLTSPDGEEEVQGQPS